MDLDLGRVLIACVATALLGPSLVYAQARTYDIVIQNGRVIDPESGLDAVRSVGIRGATIAAVSRIPLQGKQVIDARGLVVAPGFIDLEGWQLGLEGPTQSESPASPAPSLTFATVRAGREHACGLTVGGVAYCWGGLGSGSDGIAAVRTPTKVVGQP